MITKIKNFIAKETVLCIAAACAVTVKQTSRTAAIKTKRIRFLFIVVF